MGKISFVVNLIFKRNQLLSFMFAHWFDNYLFEKVLSLQVCPCPPQSDGFLS